MLRTQLPQVAAESHQHTQASKGGDHAVSSNLQYLFQEERIEFSRKPCGAVATDETIGNAPGNNRDSSLFSPFYERIAPVSDR